MTTGESTLQPQPRIPEGTPPSPEAQASVEPQAETYRQLENFGDQTPAQSVSTPQAEPNPVVPNPEPATPTTAPTEIETVVGTESFESMFVAAAVGSDGAATGFSLPEMRINAPRPAESNPETLAA